MTVSSLTYTKTVTLATGTDVVATLIHVLDGTHITVERVRAGVVSTLSNGVDYTVSDTRVEAGCTVTFVGQAANDIVTITRNVPFTQSGDYVSNQTFPPETNEDGHDLRVMLLQQLKEEIDRCIKLPIEDGSTDYGQDIPSVLLRAGTAPSFDSNGTLQWSSGSGSALANFGSAASKNVGAASIRDFLDVTVPTDEAAIVTTMLSIEGYGFVTTQSFVVHNKGGSLSFSDGMETTYDAQATGGDTVAVSHSVFGTAHRFTISGSGLSIARDVDVRWKIETFNNEANITYTAL